MPHRPLKMTLNERHKRKEWKFGATTVRQNRTKNGLQVSVDHYCAERARFRGAALAASRRPPGGSLRSYDPQPSGLKALVSVSATRRPRASSRPPYDENSQLLSQPAVSHFCGESESAPRFSNLFVVTGNVPCRWL